ncbi:protein NEDD1-like [Heptranchias perlo]|uniref:protein NEDD1-like n=1 Tax=Heptranchias perlo TaxID=212740 RepID=UPI0035593BD9
MFTDQVIATFCCCSQQPLSDVQISRFQRSLLGSVGDDGTVALWDLNSLQLQHSFDCVHKAPASALCFSPMIESLIVTVGLDKRISTFDVRSKSILHSIRTDSPLTAVELLPDGTTLVIGSSQGKVSLYDFRNMKFPVKSSKAHSTAVRCIKLQTMRGKLQAAWPTAWSNVRGGDSNLFVATDTSAKDVCTCPSDPSSLQVSSVTPSKPFAQFRKVVFLATNSFGEIFSPIRSDTSQTNISATDEFTLTPVYSASNCSPQTKNVKKLVNFALLAVGPVTKTPEMLNEDTCLTAEKCDQLQKLHNCNSKQETIEQKHHPKTLADTVSFPSVQSDEDGAEDKAASLVKTQLLQNILKDALEEFSDAHHKEVVGLQLAMIREFQIQQIAIGEVVLKHLAVSEELLEEFVTLKEENKRLKVFH